MEIRLNYLPTKEITHLFISVLLQESQSVLNTVDSVTLQETQSVLKIVDSVTKTKKKKQQQLKGQQTR